MNNWIFESWSTMAIVFFSVLLIFSIIIVITRISGLRTFAKMSSFDFASTIAIGSILASVIMNTGQSIGRGTIALGTIIAFQTLFAYVKRKSERLSKILTNKPTLIMDGEKILYENLAKTNVSEDDLIAKLRESNVRHFGEVLAVVLESTGDVSVIHSGDNIQLNREQLLKGVTR